MIDVGCGPSRQKAHESEMTRLVFPPCLKNDQSTRQYNLKGISLFMNVNWLL